MDAYKKLWDSYLLCYNKLLNEMKKSGLDVLLLRNFVNARTRIDVYEVRRRINESLSKYSGNK